MIVMYMILYSNMCSLTEYILRLLFGRSSKWVEAPVTPEDWRKEREGKYKVPSEKEGGREGGEGGMEGREGGRGGREGEGCS